MINMAKAEHILKCQQAAAEIRRDIIEMAYAAGNLGAHLGGSLSMAEILAALYIGTAKFDRNNLEWEERDRIILSKGHAALAFYPALAQAEILEKDELHTFKKKWFKVIWPSFLKWFARNRICKRQFRARPVPWCRGMLGVEEEK